MSKAMLGWLLGQCLCSAWPGTNVPWQVECVLNFCLTLYIYIALYMFSTIPWGIPWGILLGIFLLCGTVKNTQGYFVAELLFLGGWPKAGAPGVLYITLLDRFRRFLPVFCCPFSMTWVMGLIGFPCRPVDKQMSREVLSRSSNYAICLMKFSNPPFSVLLFLTSIFGWSQFKHWHPTGKV